MASRVQLREVTGGPADAVQSARLDLERLPDQLSFSLRPAGWLDLDLAAGGSSSTNCLPVGENSRRLSINVIRSVGVSRVNIKGAPRTKP